MTHLKSTGMLKKLPLPESLTKEIENLKNTKAGQRALELDKADGKQDGKISANVWNEYAKAHSGKEIQNEINVIDAMNSITTYSVREQTEVKKAELEQMKNLSEKDVESSEPKFGV